MGMTTIVDPVGTPSAIYNRSGTAVVSFAPAAIDTSVSPIGDTATEIPRVSQTTIALVTAASDAFTVRLPTDAEVGDVVEVYYIPDSTSPGPAVVVFPPTGEQIAAKAVSTGTNNAASVSAGFGSIFRKVTSAVWMYIGGRP